MDRSTRPVLVKDETEVAYCSHGYSVVSAASTRAIHRLYAMGIRDVRLIR